MMKKVISIYLFFISVDEPELHLSPYLQRAVLNYYRQIATNENEEFLALLRDIFNIDGLLGQLFVVTHRYGCAS